MKKWLALFLVLCMIPGIGCAALTEPGTFPITDSPEELTIFTIITAVQEPYEDCYQTQWYEEKTGVKINFQSFNNNEIQTQFNLSLASNDYPDIYINEFTSATTWYELYEDGVIRQLDDLIAGTTWIKKYLDEHPDVKEEITAPDGHIYTLPHVTYEVVELTYGHKMFAYKAWMDAYCAATGKGVPATTEEFRDMLIYFRDNDMNGNGDPNDEIPLTGTYSRWNTGSDPLFYLMNSFCYVPFTFIDADENDQIYTNITTDEYREGLKYIHSLYEDKLLYEGTYVQELTQFRALTSVPTDQVVVGVGTAGYPMRLLTQGSGTTWADYQALAPLKGPEGVQIAAANYVNRVLPLCAITTACENPELAIRWLDYWYSEEGMGWYMYNGVEDVDWKWDDVPSVGGGDKAIVKLTNRANETWLSYVRPCVTSKEAWYNMAATEIANNSYLAGLKAAEVYEPYAQFTNLPQIGWSTDLDLITEYNELKALLVDDYIIGAATQFIIGTLDINSDEDWNNYLKGLEERGMERFMEVAQEYYFGN